jgi:parallel beta-helix repeat protein
MIGLGLLKTATDRPAIGESILSPPEDSPVVSSQEQFSPCSPEFFGFSREERLLQVPQDHPTIQAAIDAASDGAKILIAPGTYQENLVIRRSVRLQGVARDRVILESINKDLSAVLVVGTSHPFPSNDEYFRVLIENLTVTNSSVGVEVIGVPHVLIRDNAFRNIRADSIFTAAIPATISGYVSICKNIFTGYEGGIVASPLDSQYVNIIGNTFHNADIRVYKSSAYMEDDIRLIHPRVHIYKNTIQNLKGGRSAAGILLYDAAAVKIGENTVEGGEGVGIVLGQGSEAILEGNLIRGNRHAGVEIGEGQALLKANRIENNGQPDSISLSNGGVVVDSLAQVELEGNQIVDNLGWGILTRNTAAIMACQDNRVSGNRLGDYGWFSTNPPIGPQPSPELKQKCEGN